MRRAKAAAWASLFLTFTLTERLSSQQPPPIRMLALIAALWLPLKVLGVLASGVRLGPASTLAFCFLWPGMDATPFARRSRAPLDGVRPLLATGTAAIAGGLVLLALARGLWAAGHTTSALWLALPALSLLIHFGLCNLATALWRHRGHAVRAPFTAPLTSPNLEVFWSRRWNVAFSEMTALLVYRPLSGRVGKPLALAASFAWSGLLHEAAISLPVGAGYGGPLAYFALHGWLVHRERERGRPFAPLVWVLAPLPLLFHPAFLHGVIAPLLRW